MKSFLKMSFCLIFTIIVVGNVTVVIGQTPKAEELIAKHLDAIGTEKNRNAVETRIAGGVSESKSKLPQRTTPGKFVIVSEKNNFFFVSNFAAKDYPFEKIGYFNGKSEVPVVSEGARSPLGSFVNAFNKVLSEGLFAGTISGRWCLLDTAGSKARMEDVSKGKFEGKDVYTMMYTPKGLGTEFTVKLFFDAKTYQHIRTEYRNTTTPTEVPAGSLTGTGPIRDREMNTARGGTKQIMTEDFGDFKDAGGLVMPHSYKIYYMTESDRGVYEYNWNFTISGYNFNKNLAADFFQF